MPACQHDPRPRRSPAPLLVVAVLALVLSACTPGVQLDATVRLQPEVVPLVSGSIFIVRIPEARPASGIIVRRAGAPTFTIPPGHYPPRGQCRVWRPETPPGRQDPPGSCDVLQRRVPPGGYLVYG
jgi:hypothetical protein